MPSPLAKILLFLSSYFPLLLIAALLLSTKSLWVAATCLGLGVVGLIGLLLFLRSVQRLNPEFITVGPHKRGDADTVSYFVTYLLTLLTIPMEGWERVAAFAVFFVVLGVIYVNSNLLHVNPMLTMMHYRIYELTFDDGSLHILITRRRIKQGDTLRVVRLDDDIYMEKRDGTTPAAASADTDQLELHADD